MPDLRQTLLQLIDVMSITNVSMRASVPKEDSLTFNLTEDCVNLG